YMLGKLLPKGVRISRMLWGGGTPTLFPPWMLTELAHAIAEIAPLTPSADFCVEVLSTEIDGPRIEALADAGVSRVALGMQEFDHVIQKSIGSAHDYDVTCATVEMIRARGIRSLSSDILFGLPHQNPVRFAATVQKTLAFAPNRIALYGYA